MSSNTDPLGIKGHLVTAQATYRPTGETYGIGGPGVVIHTSIILEGNQTAVLANPSSYWAELKFDLPTKLPLGDEPWAIPFEETELQVRLMPRVRGEELWTSLDTTTLPEFTCVVVRAVPTFIPARITHIVEVVLENVELLLAATDNPSLPATARQRLSIRAAFYERPYRKQILHATVPLTGEIRYHSTEPVPITDKVLERLDKIRQSVIAHVSEKTLPTSFTEKIQEIIHDFSFYGRQHASSLSRLHEQVVRDLLLLVLKHFFPSEGEVFHLRGKTDIKIINPDCRYQIAVVELKFWRGEKSIDELMRQVSSDHVTGQESLIVCQVLSCNKEFSPVVESVRSLINQHPDIADSLARFFHQGSSEVLFRSSLRVRERLIPFLVSCVDLYAPD